MSSTNERVSRSVFSVCSYVPDEIILATGMAPKRILATAGPSLADAYMHPNTCSYVKSLLASALAGDSSQMRGIVFANSCDGMRRLYDIWKAYVKAAPALFVEVPKKKDADSIEFFASELRRFAGNLEAQIGGSYVTDDRLNKAIIECNNVRRLMNQVFSLLQEVKSNIRGLSVFNLCLEGMNHSALEFAERLRKFLSDSRESRVSGKQTRIVLTGNVIHKPDLIALIEKLSGRVVVLDTCIGIRQYDTLVEENSADPMTALARRYLLKASCARMEGISDRLRRLVALARDSMADGVIYSAMKFCDNHTYEIPLIRNTLDKEGIPFLLVENDYEWSGLEQMRTRVEAFLAMCNERSVSKC